VFTPTTEQCLTILQMAAARPTGIVVATNNPTKMRQTLYRFRKEWGDPEFANLQVRASPDDTENEVWILRSNVSADPTVNFSDLM
jgi:hypothetical protein